MIVLCVVYRAEPILKALLSKTDFTLDNALEQAQRMDAAAKKLRGTHCLLHLSSAEYVKFM